MRSLLHSLLFIVCTSCFFAQNISFVDANFEKAILDNDSIIDANFDGKIQKSEAEGVKSLHLMEKNITSIADIKHFPNIEKFVVTNNRITEIKLDGFNKLLEFHCAKNAITSLSVKNLPVLTKIGFAINQLERIELENVPNLISLYGFGNKLSEVDLTKFAHLKYIDLNHNQLTKIDISKNTELVQISIRSNPLTEIDIRQNVNLNVSIMYIDDNVKIIGNKDQEGPKGVTVVEVRSPVVDEDPQEINYNKPITFEDRQSLIESILSSCKYDYLFNDMKKNLIDMYGKEKKWEEKKILKLNELIQFKNMDANVYDKAFKNYSISELRRLIENCSVITEANYMNNLSIYSRSILLEFDSYIREVCEKN